MIKVFVYGTLKDDNKRFIILNHVKTKSYNFTLENYKLKPLKYNPQYLAIEKSIGNNVNGKIIEVTKDQLTRLDKYENFMYKKDFIILDDDNIILFYVEN